MMAHAGEDETRLRTTAKRKFTRCYNRLNEALVNNLEIEIVNTKFNELSLLWDDVQSKHDLYLFAIYPAEEEPVDADQDAWIGDVEEKFELIQKAKIDYLRSVELDTKQSSELKFEEERQHRLIQDTASALRSRDSLNLMFTHELKDVRKLI